MSRIMSGVKFSRIRWAETRKKNEAAAVYTVGPAAVNKYVRAFESRSIINLTTRGGEKWKT
jgi:hypothetical protein